MDYGKAAPVVINKGNGAGDLEKLPPEIRCQTYELCLAADGPVDITRHRIDRRQHFGQPQEQLRRSKVPSGERKTDMYYLEGNTRVTKRHKTRIVRYNHAQKAAVLHLSKKVYGEALPILYNTNHFSFKSRDAFEEFARTLSNRLVYLTEISLTFKMWRRRPLYALRAVTRLKRLHLRLYNCRYHAETELEVLAKNIWSVLEPIIVSECDVDCIPGCCCCLGPGEQKKRLEHRVLCATGMETGLLERQVER